MQRIYESKSQKLVTFTPVTEGEVGMYVCGPTVQSAPHIGHLRSALVYDIMRRWFEATGFAVNFIRNVTDIDDKILEKAKKSDLGVSGSDSKSSEDALEDGLEEWWALAYRVEREFTRAYDAIGILPPTYEPRATANVTQMIELIAELIKRGHAYQALDGSADVYFDTGSWPDYGELTHQSLEQMEPAADGDKSKKNDPRDFTLWKTLKSHEPFSASWDSPWGRGRPGWHIECSAMAKRYLGDTFDIHGGGLDLRFPHHENELAQSKAAGDQFARHWVHNGLVNTRGQKMSKSLGNSLFADDLLSSERPIVVRFFLMSAHYRSTLDFSENSLQEAATSFERIEAFVQRAKDLLSEQGLTDLNFGGTEVPKDFAAAMFDDFNVPEALAALHLRVRQDNTELEKKDLGSLQKTLSAVTAMLNVLGLNPTSPVWFATSGESEKALAPLASIVEALILKRNEARKNKDFSTADEIRNQLEDANILLEDGADKTRWSIK